MIMVPQQISDYMSINVKMAYQRWSATTTYSAGSKVTYNYHEYMSVVDDNRDNTPSRDSGLWLLIGVSNHYACLDMQSSTWTTCNQYSIIDYIDSYDMEIIFSGTLFDVIGLGGIVASTVVIYEYNLHWQLINETEYDVEEDRSCSDSWYDYYFCPITSTRKTDTILHRFFPAASFLKILLKESRKGYSAVNYLVGGESFNMGEALYGSKLGLTTYSRRERDQFSIEQIDETRKSYYHDIDFVVDADRTVDVLRMIKQTVNQTMLFASDESDPDDSLYENLMLLGYVEDANIVMTNAQKSFGYITLKEEL